MSSRPIPRPAEAAPAPAVAVAPGTEVDISVPLPEREPVQARLYGQRTKGVAVPLVLHFHGGTFVCGDLDDGRNVARLLAAAGAVVLSLAYPLKPFPEPIEVGFAALEWLYKQRVKLAGKGARVYLAGEEAGGNLAAAVALMARDRAHPPLAGQILLSPMLDPCAGTLSLRKASDEDARCRWASGWQEYLSCPMNATHPYAVPGASLRLAELAPALVLVGEDDAMRDEALSFAQRLQKAGIPVTTAVLPSAAKCPDELYDPAFGDCACTETVGGHLRAFFASTVPPVPPPA
ncbi:MULTISPECIES: alpha/beta hydrolase [unclassified Variovorax]|uniref:alpha/beta hydrolase n=1 Tax=unclassified Variovorax TaxID=663243 RepID=UPI00076D33E1|nr:MULTISPECIES: alpha/beta hydrolase [unclassified Variovorax]KWT85149.1 Esterase/lipase [Variovorax sp. WDL1]PNG56586.1 Carboxylesterase NlhH [Variovorax sp. B4]PNG58010.1 Carboxylesterase NlhH [Variovorax sp. B2]VTV09512.1 Carboxylesterase NlhH [Variovorax sp. WDL1]